MNHCFETQKGTPLNKQPLVSIITPSFNQSCFLEHTILSVLNQTYPNIEYIVMDGGSRDGSVQILEMYSDRITYWESKKDKGQAHAINKGLRMAKGDILGWINSDDILLSDSVQRIVNILEELPEIDVVYGKLERINSDGEFVPTPILPKDRTTFSKEMIIGECLVNQPGSFWRRRIMEKVGLLDESLQYALDYDWWIRLALSGANFYRLSDIVAQFRLSSSSKTVALTSEMAEEQLQVLEKVLKTPNLSSLLNLNQIVIQQQANRARSHIGLHAFYGSLKRNDWMKAYYWLKYSISMDASVIFQMRWINLGLASLQRKFME